MRPERGGREGETGSGVPGGAVDLRRLVDYLDGYLAARAGADSCPNGLQVEGRPAVRRLALGVSACEELFARAAELGADAVLVHHGLFWEGAPRTLTGVAHRRVASLVKSGMSLLAYHLPLDRHPEVGNNWTAARAFGLVDLQPFGRYEGQTIGVCGRFPAPLPAGSLPEHCRRVYGQQPLAFLAGPDPLSTLAIVSGGGAKLFHEAIELGLDAFLTGEPSEWVMNVAREARAHFLAAGHHATERLGVKTLGEHLRGRFGIEALFIDVPNPV